MNHYEESTTSMEDLLKSLTALDKKRDRRTRSHISCTIIGSKESHIMRFYGVIHIKKKSILLDKNN